MDAIDFGRLVRARRKAKRLSQRDLAAAIDTGERFIVDLEAGKPTCQLGKALSVAHALGIVMADVSQHQLQPSDDDDDDLPAFHPPPAR